VETPSVNVRHNSAERRFEILLDGNCAVLDYEISGGTVIVTHTEVPPQCRGRGLAEALVRAALAWIGREGLRVEPRCEYAARFIERHPEFHPLRA